MYVYEYSLLMAAPVARLAQRQKHSRRRLGLVRIRRERRALLRMLGYANSTSLNYTSQLADPT
jgi:hypothetical protein